jgi:broad specificity phosphatase PhoE
MFLIRWIARTLLLALVCTHAALQAGELAERLLAGQHVLLMRHAYAPGVGDPAGYTLDRCETQRVLDAQGRQQAARIGQWLRSQGLQQARVYSSAWCRCRETAERLALGPVTLEASLGSFFNQPQRGPDYNRRLQAFIARQLQESPGAPLVLVTHHVNIQEFMGQAIGSGDMVLARVDARGRMVAYTIYPSP